MLIAIDSADFLFSISTFSPNGSIIDYVELGNIIDSAISLIGSSSNYNRIIFSASDGTYIQTYNLYKVGSTLPETGPPFGSFETPINGSTVSSSIAVTGWALDESGIDSVKIYWAQGNTLVYIGDAMLVEGARPDVASAYPEYPNNTKAGWGYMMLTNFLPGGGNGIFVIHAIGTDAVGKTSTIGTKTITVDNLNTVKPFSAIDTPTEGGTASGSSYVNWGWVLTPMPNSIPTDGSTINIWVDSVNLVHPSYNKYREDIANFFPGFANSEGAVGLFYLDTTGYKNGVHTIHWTATDNAGNTDGIGSRYFTIQSTGSSRAQWASSKQAIMLDLPKISELPIDFSESVRMKRNFNKQIVPEIITPNEKGVSRSSIRELERIELQLADKESIVDGYLVSGSQLRPLPVGSTIKNGVFHWIPGPGFIGEYRLIFVIKDKNDEFTRREILIKIVPKFARNK